MNISTNMTQINNQKILGVNSKPNFSNIMVRYTPNILNYIENFNNHSSCKIIKKHLNDHITFTFRHVTTDEVKKVIHDLKNDKVGGEIPAQIFKICDCILDILKNCINQSIETFNFLDCLKPVNITPVFKKDVPLDKLTYRPVITLHLLSKVCEELIYN